LRGPAGADLRAFGGALRELSRVGGREPRLLALGWATVDGARAAAEAPDLDFRPADPEPALGARAWLTRAGPLDLVLLEPTTEGRLAAALARRGEGLTVVYVAVDALDGDGSPTALGVPGRLLGSGARWGPFVITIATSAPGGAARGVSSGPRREAGV
jgi:hypothetical protein